MKSNISTLDNNVVFVFNSRLRLTLAPSVTMNSFNLVNLSGYTVLSSEVSKTYKGVNQFALNDFVGTVLNQYNLNKQFKLLRSEYPLNINFEEINQLKMIKDNGLLIAGVYRQFGKAPSQYSDNNFKGVDEKIKFLA